MNICIIFGLPWASSLEITWPMVRTSGPTLAISSTRHPIQTVARQPSAGPLQESCFSTTALRAAAKCPGLHHQTGGGIAGALFLRVKVRDRRDRGAQSTAVSQMSDGDDLTAVPTAWQLPAPARPHPSPQPPARSPQPPAPACPQPLAPTPSPQPAAPSPRPLPAPQRCACKI